MKNINPNNNKHSSFWNLQPCNVNTNSKFKHITRFIKIIIILIIIYKYIIYQYESMINMHIIFDRSMMVEEIAAPAGQDRAGRLIERFASEIEDRS